MMRSIFLLVAVAAIIGLNAMKITEDADVPPAPVEKPAEVESTPEARPESAKKPAPPGLRPVGDGFPGKGVPQRPHVQVQVVVPKPVVAIQHPPRVHVQSKPILKVDAPKPNPGQVVVAIKEHIKEHGPKHHLGVSPPPRVLGAIKDAKENGFKFPAEFIQHLHVLEAAVKAAKEQKPKEGDVVQVCIPLDVAETALQGARRHFHHVVAVLHAGKNRTHHGPNKDGKPLPLPLPEIKVQTKPALENIILRPADSKKPFLNDALPAQQRPAALPFKPLLIKPIVKPVTVVLPPEALILNNEGPKQVNFLPPADHKKPFLDDALPAQQGPAALPFKPLLIRPIVKPVFITLPPQALIAVDEPIKQVVAPKPALVKPARKPKPAAPKPAEDHGAEKAVGLSVE